MGFFDIVKSVLPFAAGAVGQAVSGSPLVGALAAGATKALTGGGLGPSLLTGGLTYLGGSAYDSYFGQPSSGIGNRSTDAFGAGLGTGTSGGGDFLSSLFGGSGGSGGILGDLGGWASKNPGLAAGGALGLLMAANGISGQNQNSVQSVGSSGKKHKGPLDYPIPPTTLVRNQTNPTTDWYTYGMRPEQLFYDNPAGTYKEMADGGWLKRSMGGEITDRRMHRMDPDGDGDDDRGHMRGMGQDPDNDAGHGNWGHHQFGGMWRPRFGGQGFDPAQIQAWLSQQHHWGQGQMMLPQPDGAIRGPGGPRDDKIPTALSNGEYVLTTADVNHIGGGNNRRGAEILDQRRRDGGLVSLRRAA